MSIDRDFQSIRQSRRLYALSAREHRTVLDETLLGLECVFTVDTGDTYELLRMKLGRGGSDFEQGPIFGMLLHVEVQYNIGLFG